MIFIGFIEEIIWNCQGSQEREDKKHKCLAQWDVQANRRNILLWKLQHLATIKVHLTALYFCY